MRLATVAVCIGCVLALSAGVGVAQEAPAPPHETFPDCDRDGFADIFWNDFSTTGSAFTVWYMKAQALQSETEIAGPVFFNWKAVGMGDYKNTRKPQIVWRNQDSGRLVIWISQTQCPAHEAANYDAWTPDETDLTWEVRSMSDLGKLSNPTDRFGNPGFDHLNDIVWQHITASSSEDAGYGQLRVWYTKDVPGPPTSGFVYDARDIYPNYPDSPDWLLVGGGDFGTSSSNAVHDDHTDLLFQHQGTGALQIWYMDSNRRREKVDVATVPPPGCAVAAVADYGTDASEDGRDFDADVVFDCGAGGLKMWFMQGSAKVQSDKDGEANIEKSAPGGTWKLVHPQ